MKFSRQYLEEYCKKRPQGYFQDVMDLAKATEDGLYDIDEEAYRQLALKYRAPIFKEKIASLLGSLADAAINPGSRSREEITACANTCNQCQYFIVENFQCGICGCNLNFKMKLKAWHCPINRW